MSNAQIAVAADPLDLLAWHGARPDEAFGETYDPGADGLRITNQMTWVWRGMRHGHWTTYDVLRKLGVPGMDTSISARIRELRKWLEETGRGTVESERQANGLWRFRIVRTWPIAGMHYR